MFNKDRVSSNSTDNKDDWHRDLVNRLAFAAVDEQRRARRWSIFFKFLLALYLLSLLVLYMPTDWSDLSKVSEKHTALVDLKGVISDSTEASADNVITGLRNAFEDENTAGVILRANSPGGSPVQSAYIYDEIKRLRELYPDTPLYAVVTDVCASGATTWFQRQMISTLTSPVLSAQSACAWTVSVLSTPWKSSVLNAGCILPVKARDSWTRLLPAKASDVEHVKVLLESIHEQFITAVKTGRGDRLKENPKLYYRTGVDRRGKPVRWGWPIKLAVPVMWPGKSLARKTLSSSQRSPICWSGSVNVSVLPWRKVWARCLSRAWARYASQGNRFSPESDCVNRGGGAAPTK